jgi:trans-2,3-dihydro-3-hydroxyanthranilate isomerase
MKYRFYTCDVFTETRFGGNPLAVLPAAEGLSDHQMQQIAREFNFSESTFVFPPTAGHRDTICGSSKCRDRVRSCRCR